MSTNVLLEAPSLILPQLTAEDTDELVALDGDPKVMRHINGGIPSGYEAIAERFLPYAMSYYDRENLGFWAIVEKGSNEFIDWIFLRPEGDFELLQQLNLAEADAIELGYRLCRTSWNKGYTTEACRELIKKAVRESNIAKITAWALAENTASLRVMEKAGLQRQQEYVVSADNIHDPSLLESPLVRNLLDRTVVRYQWHKDCQMSPIGYCS